MFVSSHGLSSTLCSTHEPEASNASLGYRHTVFILFDTGSKNLALVMLLHFFVYNAKISTAVTASIQAKKCTSPAQQFVVVNKLGATNCFCCPPEH